MTKILDLFEFSDYRKFISAWLDRARATRDSNLTKLSAKLSVHTSFLGHVLSGSKNLSIEQAHELAEVIGLTSLEQDYFFTLVHREKAGTLKLKNYWSQKSKTILQERLKLNSRVGEYRELTAVDQATFYSSWIYLALFVAAAIEHGQSLEQLMNRFNLSRERAVGCLDFLVRTGALILKDGTYQMGPSTIYLPANSPLITKHHTNWRLQAMNQMETAQQSDLFFSSPMSMSKSDFLLIREMLAQSLQSALKVCKDSPAEEVYCLNIDFFQV